MKQLPKLTLINDKAYNFLSYVHTLSTPVSQKLRFLSESTKKLQFVLILRIKNVRIYTQFTEFVVCTFSSTFERNVVGLQIENFERIDTFKSIKQRVLSDGPFYVNVFPEMGMLKFHPNFKQVFLFFMLYLYLLALNTQI